ncbi:aminotransferase class III-fold pyridoxal phosphate-dependent enzyme [Microvirga yunnanensis]|uniref:aminotransferase class III-fold pyridoxal phosphate-dependent enzyme n=1 Tax=Microvirga yunnanensis TaxID=2953740 RepID=UPI0021CA933D|nr:aminotransferase class III-fold pyridoxal phosphate-dependent enzyme [Microvirga sp. HBU65207]
MLSNSLVELDRQHLIHPVAPYRAHEARGVTVIASGEGAYVRDAAGNRLLDGFAGLWCVNAGYGQPTIIEAINRQLQELQYATGYFHFGAETPIRLAARLAELAPGDLNRVYFTLGGSDAVDTTIRFIRYYFNALGKPEKKQFITLEQGYHGSSSTGSGLTALPLFHAGFDVPLAWQHRIPSPYPYRNPVGSDGPTIIAASLEALKAKVAELGGPEKVAAFYCEPIQGSGGVIVPPEGWVKAMRNLCAELDILFVADEVITGFGRTGPIFACEHEGIVPDLMTMAKGLTSGYLPMGAVMMRESVYSVIADASARSGMAVGHGFTYSGHPVSAAAGLAAIALYTEGGLMEQGRRSGEALIAGLKTLEAHPLVGEARGRGMLAALEIVSNKNTKAKFDPSVKVGEKLFDAAYANGLIIRAFGDGTLGFAPPLCCSQDDIALLLERTRKTLDDLLGVSEIRKAAA